MNKLAATNLTEPRRPRLALRFISGKYQGGEFPLIEGQEIVIGRSSDLDMVLVEEMVSRRHARIVLEEGVILYPNTAVIGRALVRARTVISQGTSVINRDTPGNCVVYPGEAGDLVFKPSTRDILNDLFRLS